jgi:hypothetical protein
LVIVRREVAPRGKKNYENSLVNTTSSTRSVPDKSLQTGGMNHPPRVRIIAKWRTEINGNAKNLPVAPWVADWPDVLRLPGAAFSHAQFRENLAYAG